MDRRRKLLASVSLANLALVPTWLELLYRRPGTSYFMKRLPEAQDFLAALADLGLISALLFGLFVIAERWKVGRVVLALGIIAALAIPAEAVRVLLPKEVGFGAIQARGLVALVPALGLACLVGFLALKHRTRLLSLGSAAVLLLSPFAALNMVKTLSGAVSAQADPSMASPPLASTPVVGRASGHVVWMIFDEMDYRLVFLDRPPGIQLPEFDRLRAQSVFATDAHPPATETRRSVPSLLTGRVVQEATVRGASDLALTFEGGPREVAFGEAPTVFTRARALGAETEVVGWYHPYCRMLAASLTRCTWRPVNQTVIGRSDSDSFGSSLIAQLQGLAPTGPRQLHIEAYRGIHADAMAALEPGRSGLQFFHFPVPHSPSIYDAERGETTLMRWGNVSGYPENLVLADRLLGDVRRKMLASGTWDAASIVLSADHPWRQSLAFDGKQDARVPFLLKVPGQTTAVEHASRFETVRTGRVILELLMASKPTPEDARAWLARTDAAFAGDFR